MKLQYEPFQTSDQFPFITIVMVPVPRASVSFYYHVPAYPAANWQYSTAGFGQAAAADAGKNATSAHATASDGSRRSALGDLIRTRSYIPLPAMDKAATPVAPDLVAALRRRWAG